MPAMSVPGRLAIGPGGQGMMIPGPRQAADSVLGFFREGTSIITGHGQQMMAAGASLTRRSGPAAALHGRWPGRQERQEGRVQGTGAPTSVAVRVRSPVGTRRPFPPRATMGCGRSTGAAHPQWFGTGAKSIFKPPHNANAAYSISEKGTDWNPWTTFKSGAYRGWMDRAKKAISWCGWGGAGEAVVRPVDALSPAGVLQRLLSRAEAALGQRHPAGHRGGHERPCEAHRSQGEQGDGPGNAKGRLGAVVREASRIDRMRVPYVYGGGHSNPAPSGGPWDCSSSVARVMQAAGFKNFPTRVLATTCAEASRALAATCRSCDTGPHVCADQRQGVGHLGGEPVGFAGLDFRIHGAAWVRCAASDEP